jgi:hypothetical protein
MYLVACKRTKGVFAALRAATSRALFPKGLALVVTAAILAGCSACAPALSQYEAPVIPTSDLVGRAGMTYCSYNNRPIVYADSATLRSVHGELILKHEQTHAARMSAYGCWAFLYRYRSDRAFRVREELAAYCAEGRLAIERNFHPQDVWDRVKAALSRDTTLTDRDNCVSNPWGPER